MTAQRGRTDLRRRTAPVVVAALALAGCSGGQEGPAPTSAGTSSTSASEASEPPRYLALGDSLAAGYQPGKGDDKDGGYVAGVLSAQRRTHPGLRLTNLGCSGEDTVSYASGSRCDYAQGSQQKAAIDFLRKHRSSVRLITIDLGANDVQRCARESIDVQCLTKGLQQVQQRLPAILEKLHDAAPDAQLVVANYYNPFLGLYVRGGQARSLAQASGSVAKTLNDNIRTAAQRVSATVADVGAAFSTTTTTPVTVDGKQQPTNVARICQWTWMCSRTDIHANDTGYRKIAAAINKAIAQRAAASS